MAGVEYGGSSRAVRLNRFVRDRPNDAAKLVLIMDLGNGEEEVGSWLAAELGGGAPPGDQLDATCTEWATHRGRRTTGEFHWLNADGKLRGTKLPLRVDPDTNADDYAPPEQFDGSTESRLSQSQTHLEVMMRIHHASHTEVFKNMRALLDMQAEMLRSALELRQQEMAESSQLKQVIDGMHDKMLALEAEIAERDNAAESEGRDEFYKLAEMALMQYLGPAAAAARKKAA